MTKRIRTLLLALAVLWPSRELASATGLKLQKSANSVAITAPGADDIDVIPVGDGKWAIVLAVGSPPRVEIIYLHATANPAPTPPDPQDPEATRLAREWINLVAESSRGRAAALADAFRSVAARIDKGELSDPASIIQASTEANRAALGEDRNAWLPWFEKLREYMNGLAEKGTLKTAPDHAKLFREIANGLDRPRGVDE